MRWGLLITFLVIAGALQARSQSLEMNWDELGLVYAEARAHLTFQTYVQENGAFVPFIDVAPLPVASDTLIHWIKETMGILPKDPDSNEFQGDIHSSSLVSISERSQWFERFEDTKWAYLGNNYLTSLDTIDTSIIRAHLEGLLGPPTQTITETHQGDPTLTGGNSQFEYWLTVNDSIPMIVMDVRGPFDRGIIVATDHRFRSLLFRMRQSLFTFDIGQIKPVPYVDYYYHMLTEKWYLTGFNGTEYFVQKVDRPNFEFGRPTQRLSQSHQKRLDIADV